jgi:catechol 2,3-dioxygenase-like lactoylglutathione lyase family enzyme
MAAGAESRGGGDELLIGDASRRHVVPFGSTDVSTPNDGNARFVNSRVRRGWAFGGTRPRSDGLQQPLRIGPVVWSGSAKMHVVASFPSFRSVVLDTSDARGLAEFYRHLLGFRYRDGDERPPFGQPDPIGSDFLMLVDPFTGMRLAFQQVEGLQRSTWPSSDVPQQLHLDLSVSDAVELATQRDRALSLGATLLDDRSDDPRELLYVFVDPAGHPFCIFVVSPS